MTGIVTLAVDLAIGSAFVAAAVLAFEHRGRPGVIPFVALSLILVAMVGGAALGREGIVPESWLPYAVFVPFVFASLAWIVLAFEFTGRGPVVTGRRVAGLAVFGVTVIVTTLLGSFVPDSVRPLWLILINVVQVALVTAVGYGAVLVARSAISYDDLPRSGSLALTTAGGGIIVVTLLQLLAPAVPYATVFGALQGVLAAVAGLLLLTQVRYRVFETGPSAGHLARETLLDEMTAAVAITGRENQLLDFNRAAERTFGLDRPGALGDPVDDTFGFDPEATDTGTVELDTESGRRQFELDRMGLTSRGGDSVGRAYLLRDVTERRTHEQRLDVLNRVLRHNLRNDLDAIRGFAEALEDPEADVDRVALATAIRRTARNLAALGTTLDRADRLLEGTGTSAEPVEVGTLVTRLVETVGESYSDVSATVSTPGDPVTLRTDRDILETVLEETVENAFEHNDSDTPLVELAVRRERSQVVIEVRDNGPGIPDEERSVLLEGEETPLRHGSGLGLWLVYWGITRLGGTLDFRENDPRGSVVSLRIPEQ